MDNKPTPFLKRVSDIEKTIEILKKEIENLTNKLDAIRKSLKR